MTVHTLGTNNTSIAGAPPADDAAGEALYNELVVLSGSGFGPFFRSLASDLLNALKDTPHVFSQMTAAMDAYLSQNFAKAGQPFCDVYMHYQTSDGSLVGEFINGFINETLPPGYSYTLPASVHYTNNDQLYYNMAWWMGSYAPGDDKPLAQAFLDQLVAKLGSNGDPKDVPGLVSQLFADPNFFKNYPQFDPAANPNAMADIQAFVSEINSLNPSPTQLPDYLAQYLQTGFDWNNPDKNSDSAKLQNAFLQLMRAAWPTNDLASLQAAASALVNPGSNIEPFPGYPNLDIDGAKSLEKIFGVKAPALQDMFFQARAHLSAETAGSPGAAMWQHLIDIISMSWTTGGIAAVKNAFTDQFQTTDAYMQYYNVSEDDISSMLELAYRGCPLSITAQDIKYRDIANYRDTLAKGSADYTLMDETCAQLSQFGSNPTADQVAQIEGWADSLAMDPSSDFYKVSAATQAKFLSEFSYSVSLSSYIGYLNQWAGPTSPDYDQQFAATLIGIIQGYAGSQTDPSKLSKADFQNYLDEYYGDIDYSLMFPGLTQADINSVYAALGLTNPYHPPGE